MPVDFHVEDGVATLVINRPDRHNAMDPETYDQLSSAWTAVRDDPAIRVAVVTGAGDRAFSVGADLKSPQMLGDGAAEFWRTQERMLLNRGLEIWKPVIAAVNGYCLGGGMTLLLATDLRLAAPHATFGLPEVKRGLLPGNGGTQRLAAQLPHARAMRLLLLGDAIDARTALDWGLITEIVPAAELLDTAMGYARRIAAHAPLSMQAVKELVIRSRSLAIQDGLRMEQGLLHVLQYSADVKEGLRAFAEKREPEFEGR
ncbi:enoyl-CoA hydratase/isomerase family protein [Actinophytocola sp.]|uniref:enoyl-CoA hydratase/isomerase family protein n=1 Tax=Actinophytocola sp. TaxID=1872138 RepID=UPI003D6C39FF